MLFRSGAKSYTNGDELYLDCNEEFPIVTRSKVVDEDEPKSRSESLSREKRAKDQHTDNFPISERQIYEMQLSQLQEQLVNTMIDYQEACKSSRTVVINIYFFKNVCEAVLLIGEKSRGVRRASSLSN